MNASGTLRWVFALLAVGSLSVARAQCTDYDLVVGGGTAPAQIHWELYDALGNLVVFGDAPENTGECLPAGCYTMVMYDDGNNGWNGGAWTLYLQNTSTVVTTGTLSAGGYGTMQFSLGGVPCGPTGCSDQQIVVTAGSAPLDVWWELYDELGNYVGGGGAPDDQTICLPDGCYVMYLYDNAGDGWNGAAYTITDVASGSITSTGTLSGGGFGMVQVIVGAGCGTCDPYVMNVSAGTAPADISWELYDASFILVAAGGAPASIPLCLAPDCYTLYMNDAMGNGWNGAQYTFVDQGTSTTVASGTLVSGPFGTSLVSIAGGCTTGPCSTYTMTVTAGSAPVQVGWNLTSMGITYASGTAPANVTMCLDTGCYVMQLFDAGANGWNGATWTLTNGLGAVVGTGTLATGATGAAAIPLGNGPCSVPQVVSASDCPDAVNVCTNLNFTIDPNGSGAIWEIPSLGSTSNPEFWYGDAIMSPWGTDHYGCLMGQEINTTWMIVNVATSGTLEFTLGANGSQSGFYDWTMFPYSASTCGAIVANTLTPVRCNWNFASYGGTGCVATVPAGGVPENFEPPLNVLAGQRYIICFSNWSSVTTVVPLLFGGSATVNCDPIVLPVELTDIHSHANLWSVFVDWSTATEHNTSHFDVQRSVDLWDWRTIGRVEAAGNAVTQHNYRFTDEAPLEQDLYYRLSIVDQDGTVRTSPIVRTGWEAPTLHCWPNPAPGSFLVALGEHRDLTTLKVLDLYGREVDFEALREGDDEVRVLLTDPRPGIHIVQATDGALVRTGRVVIE